MHSSVIPQKEVYFLSLEASAQPNDHSEKRIDISENIPVGHCEVFKLQSNLFSDDGST